MSVFAATTSGFGATTQTTSSRTSSSVFGSTISSPFTSKNTSVFAGTSTPTFGQNTPAPVVGASGISLSTGASSAPAQGFAGPGTFGCSPSKKRLREM
ncbi:Nuclear envelope pore membrane protein POM 121C [Manis javanica]|nr:Nuclear envelope pore membrane protein POM 121C [Manis javanica]